MSNGSAGSDSANDLAAAISAATGANTTIDAMTPLGGGCIHDAMRVTTTAGDTYFVKRGEPQDADLFAAEADGLEALRAPGCCRIPAVITHGATATQAFLVLEFVAPAATGDPARAGEAVAALHGHTANAFGWHRDNYIGTTPQANREARDWAEFWRGQRLQPLLDRLARAGDERLADHGHRLAAVIPALLGDHQPQPALLHGDLWAGNAAYDEHGVPLLFDPAVYRGDHEADLAMTELFGGFPARFYAAHEAVHPRKEGYSVRREMYNLYHVLNHALLFGGGYGDRARRMIDRLLAEAG